MRLRSYCPASGSGASCLGRRASARAASRRASRSFGRQLLQRVRGRAAASKERCLALYGARGGNEAGAVGANGFSQRLKEALVALVVPLASENARNEVWARQTHRDSRKAVLSTAAPATRKHRRRVDTRSSNGRKDDGPIFTHTTQPSRSVMPVRRHLPVHFRYPSARLSRLVALEAQLRPHTFGEQGRKQLHQGPEQPRQAAENGRAREARKVRVALFRRRR